MCMREWLMMQWEGIGGPTVAVVARTGRIPRLADAADAALPAGAALCGGNVLATYSR
jgi:hypothetical protein